VPHRNLKLSLYSYPLPCHKSQLTFPHCRWIARVGKAEALAAAGITLPPSGSDDVNGVPEVIQKNQGTVKVVAFNVVSAVRPALGLHIGIMGNGFLPHCLSRLGYQPHRSPGSILPFDIVRTNSTPQNDNDPARPERLI